MEDENNNEQDIQSTSEVARNEGGEAMTSEEIRAAIQEAEAKGDENKGEEVEQDQQDNDDKGGDNSSGEEIEGDTEEKEDEAEDEGLDELFEVDDIKKEEKEEKKTDEEKVEDEDDVSEEDAKLINKLVDRKLKEALEPMTKQKEALEIETQNVAFDKYIEENPQFTKYKDNIKPYVSKLYGPLVKQGIKLEDGSTLKIKEGKFNDFLASFVLGKGMLKIGANMKSSADSKAQRDDQSGGNRRKTETDGGIVDASSLDKQDFEAMVESAKRGKFTNMKIT